MPHARITALDAGRAVDMWWPIEIYADMLSRMTALTRLRCACRPRTRERVWQLTRLQHLDVHCPADGPAVHMAGTWHGLSALTALRSLALSHFDRSLQEDAQHALSALRALQQLTYLRLFSAEIIHGPEVHWEPSLSSLAGLQHLSISWGCSCERLLAALPALRGPTALQFICQNSILSGRPCSWQPLSHLTRLQLLDLSAVDVVPPAMSMLAQLTELAMRGALHGGFEHLAPLTRLRKLSLKDNGSLLFDDFQLFPIALAALPPLPRLEALSLARCYLSSVPFRVSALTALTLLNLSYNDM